MTAIEIAKKFEIGEITINYEAAKTFEKMEGEIEDSGEK